MAMLLILNRQSAALEILASKFFPEIKDMPYTGRLCELSLICEILSSHCMYQIISAQLIRKQSMLC